MAHDDVYGHVKVITCLAPVVVAANGAVNGATVDRLVGRTFYRSASVVVHTGVVTDGTYAVNIQESVNGTDWTTVAATHLVGTKPTVGITDDGAVFEIGYQGSQRFLRPVITAAGVTVGALVSAVVLLGVQPVTRP